MMAINIRLTDVVLVFKAFIGASFYIDYRAIAKLVKSSSIIIEKMVKKNTN